MSIFIEAAEILVIHIMVNTTWGDSRSYLSRDGNVPSSIPATFASRRNAMWSIKNPLPFITNRTLAVVSIAPVAKPAASQAKENAIVKHAACAARHWHKHERQTQGSQFANAGS